MFDAMAEWMTIPLLNQECGKPFQRIGLAHPTIVPYGVFKTRDGADILIAIQNDREWRVLADKVLGDASLGTNEKFATVPSRLAHRDETNTKVAAVFSAHDVEPLMKTLAAADIAFARVNDSALLGKHPHLRRITVGTPSGPASIPAPAPLRANETQDLRPDPGAGRTHRADQKGIPVVMAATPLAALACVLFATLFHGVVSAAPNETRHAQQTAVGCAHDI